MAGRIPQEFIDDLLARTDIVGLVGERVALRRMGSNYKGLCPFHQEKTPSFVVNPQRQTYHCFGCGAHGTALGFLMEHDGLPFREAVTELAERNGLPLPETAGRGEQRDDLSPLYDVLAEANRRFQEALKRHPKREAAVNYLRQRGITGEVAARFGLGFAPPGWDFLLGALGSSSALSRAGLVVEKEGRAYDRFRDRITFPIRDRRGRVVGFGGRTVGDGEPKYLNSPETPVFHKGREVYGLYEALHGQRRPEQLILVEGYMDVIALAQAGVPGAVATLGTATSREQAQALLRSTSRLTFCFDGDTAGRQAALRATENVLPLLGGDREVRVLLLDSGDDPDTFVRREGAERFNAELTAAVPAGDFFFEALTAECDRTTVDGRARLLARAVPTLKSLPTGAFREVMVERLAELSVTERSRVEQLLADKKGDGGLSTTSEPPGEAARRSAASSPRARGPGRDQAQRTPVRWAVALLVQDPSLGVRGGEPDRFADRPLRGLDVLQQLLEVTRQNPQITTARVLTRFQGSEYEGALWRLAQWSIPADSDWEQLFDDALHRVEEAIVAEEQRITLQEIDRLDAGGADAAAATERLRRAQHLQWLLERARSDTLSEGEREQLRALRGEFRLDAGGTNA